MTNRLALLSVSFALSLTSLAAGQASWHRRWPATLPASRHDALFACDEARGASLLLFGQGGNNNNPFNELWSWDGTNWSLLPVSLPSPRYGSAMTWDSARQRVVLFGGVNAQTGSLQDLWEWNGTLWTVRTPAFSPPVRSAHGLTCDRSRGVLVLFGGYNNAGTLNDTWEWNGTQWSQRVPVHQPSPRRAPALAWDPTAHAVLCYGGDTDANGWTDETWHWDGTDWRMLTPQLTPSIRASPGLTSDLHRRRVILFGGNPWDNSTWEWDGAQWNDLQLPAASPRIGPAMAYDATRRETVLFGGSDPAFNYLNDTWTWSTQAPAAATAYGAGCPGSVAVPLLANDDFRLPWIGDTVVMRASNLAPTAPAAFFATGISSSPPLDLGIFGMPGCNGLVLLPTAEFAPVTAGSALWQLAVPSSPSFVGVHLYQQALVLEPGANAAGAITSNGVDLVAGIR